MKAIFFYLSLFEREMCKDAMETREEKSLRVHSSIKEMGLKSKKNVLRTRLNVKTVRSRLAEERGNVHQSKKLVRRSNCGMERQVGLGLKRLKHVSNLVNLKNKTQTSTVPGRMAPTNTTQYIMDRVYEDMCDDWLKQEKQSSTEFYFHLDDGTQIPFEATPAQPAFERTLDFLQRDFENVLYSNEI